MESKFPVSNETALRSYEYEILFNKTDVYIYHKFLDTSCSINLINLRDRSKIFKINIPDTLLKYKCSRYNADGMAFYGDTIYLQIANYLILYKIDKGQTSLVKLLDLNSVFKNNLNYYSNRIIADSCCIYGVNDQFKPRKRSQINFSFWTVNVFDPSKNKFELIEEPQGFYWTIFQPRSIMDYSGNKILAADITDYKIRLFNMDGQLKDSIIRNIPAWFAAPYSIEEFRTDDPRNVINKLQNDTSSTASIHNVHFINHNKILVCYSLKTRSDNEELLYHEYYDIWEKNSNGWFLKYHDIDSYYLKMKQKEDERFTPLGRSYKIFQDKIITFHYRLNDSDSSYILIRRIKN